MLALASLSSTLYVVPLRKSFEYQRLGILEYWIVDYLAVGSRDILGNPKQPTIMVYLLDKKGVYGTDKIVSRTFPELTLTVEQILAV